jgi:molybdate transport system substrate-binding protein
MESRVLASRLLRAAAAVLLLCSASACAGERAAVLEIAAASSLSDVFADVAREFERDNPETVVRLSFAGSQTLRLQLEQGLRADVFASAHPAHLESLREAGLLTGAKVFARNDLVIAVEAGNPRLLRTPRDLMGAERIVIAAATVPAGMYTREFLARADAAYGPEFSRALMSNVVSLESNVRLARAKVQLGEADAAIVYRTDARVAAGVGVVEIPPELNVAVDYLVAALVNARNPALAARWIDYLDSQPARSALARHGFLLP